MKLKVQDSEKQNVIFPEFKNIYILIMLLYIMSLYLDKLNVWQSYLIILP